MARGWVLLALGELSLNSCASGRQVSQRIGVVNLAKHVIGQADAGDSPAAVQRRAGRRPNLGGMVEVLVVGLEESPMGRPELLDSPAGIAVRSQQNSVLVFEEELTD